MYDTIEKHYKENYGKLVKRYTRSAGSVWAAEDVVQTAFERALKYVSTHPPPDLFEHWFNTILRNSLIDYVNEDRGAVFEELDEFEWEAPDVSRSNLLSSTITKLISLEPEDNRPILELHFLQGYKAREIYEFNRFSYPNTRKIIQRFRDKLKVHFKK